MPNTDIDGSPIAILSETEARLVYRLLIRGPALNLTELKLATKLARDFSLPPPVSDTKGNWRIPQ